MKVLNVIHYPVFGGPHNEVLRSAALLRRRGWESITILPDEPGSAADRLRAAGLEVVQVPLHRLRAKPDPRLHLGLTLTFFPEVQRIRELIKRLDADVVKVMGLVNPHGGVAARLAGRPIVWQVVDTGLPPFVRQVATSIARPLADAFLFNGQGVAELHDAAHRFSQPSFTYFPPVDTTLFSPSPERGLRTRRALGIPSDAYVVGTVSNLSPQKGLECLIEAAARIHVGVDNVWFLVVGASYASHRRYLARLKTQIAESVLPAERVIFTDAVPDPEQYYPAMNVKLVTSPPRSEGTTTTALEALACGVPVISTDVGAVAEVIDIGRTGIVVPPLDAAAIADATVAILTDQDRRASMSECARRSAIERFGVERYCDVVSEACEAARDHQAARQRRTSAAWASVAGTAGHGCALSQGSGRKGDHREPVKRRVQRYWEDHPCGTGDEVAPRGSRGFFVSTESTRVERDGFMQEIVRFERWRGLSVLEVGCGIGVDTARFARAGANVWAVDFSPSAVTLTRSRLASEGLTGHVLTADAEALPFADASFDLVFSWGVVHHTPCPEAAAAEIQRVCKPTGRVLVMVYGRHSLVAGQAWVRYGLLEGHPWASPSRLIRDRVESDGTRVYDHRQVRSLFSGLPDPFIRSVVTAWDLRVGRRRFLPDWTRRLVPSRFGWFVVLDGAKR